MDRHFLNPLFSPKSIVVFAGNPDKPEAPTPMAATVRRELRESGYAGQLTWLDIEMSGTLADLAQSRADLAVIALPAEQVSAAMEIVGRIRCRAALVLSSGLPLKLNVSTLGPLAAPGPLALVSQSGALTAAILDWARHNGVGFSAVVSLGPNTVVELPQVLDYLANDAGTQSILVYMEGIRSARRFMSALRAAAYAKPVVVMKAGRRPAGTRAVCWRPTGPARSAWTWRSWAPSRWPR